MKPGPVSREMELRRWLRRLPHLQLQVEASLAYADESKRLVVWPAGKGTMFRRTYTYPLDIKAIKEEWKLQAVIAALRK